MVKSKLRSFQLSVLDFIILGAIALVRHGKQMNKVFPDLMILSHERPCIVFLPTTCTVSSLLIVVSLSRSVSCLVLSSRPSAFVLLAVRNPRRDPPPCYGPAYKRRPQLPMSVFMGGQPLKITSGRDGRSMPLKWFPGRRSFW